MPEAEAAPSDWPPGGSEMAAKLREFDWSATPLGPIADWPASDARSALDRAGAEIVGPFARQDEAAEALAARRIDCALLDINLGDGPSFALADRLGAAGIPFLFVTGYDAATIPESLRSAPRIEKPFRDPELVEAVVRLVGG